MHNAPSLFLFVFLLIKIKRGVETPPEKTPKTHIRIMKTFSSIFLKAYNFSYFL